MAVHANTREQFACPEPECSRSYMHKRNLTAHCLLRHNPDGSRRFECDMCGAKLSTKQKIKMHLDWHIRTPDGVRTVRQPVGAMRRRRKDKGVKRKLVNATTGIFEMVSASDAERMVVDGFEITVKEEQMESSVPPVEFVGCDSLVKCEPETPASPVELAECFEVTITCDPVKIELVIDDID